MLRFDVQTRAILSIENVEANALVGSDLLSPDMSLKTILARRYERGFGYVAEVHIILAAKANPQG